MYRKNLVFGLAAILMVLSFGAVVAGAVEDSEAAVSITDLQYRSDEGFTFEVADGTYRAVVYETGGLPAAAVSNPFEVSGGKAVFAPSSDISSGKGYVFKLYSKFDFNNPLCSVSFTTCNVSFDANGGSGTMADIVVSVGCSFELPTCGFTAPADQSFKAWSIGGIEKNPGDSVTIANDTVVKAVWESSVVKEATVTVKSNDDSMGSVSPSSIKVPYGSEITVKDNVLTINDQPITATPEKQTVEKVYSFSSWSVKTGDKVEKDMTITATFASKVREYTVTVKSNDDSMGSAVLYNGENAIIESGSEVEYGTLIVVKIAQTEGYKLTGLKDNGNDCTVALEYIFIVDAKHVIEVVFTKTTEISYTVSIEATGNGTVSPSKDGSYIMYGEQSQIFKVSADFGWKIKNLTLDGKEISGGSKILKEVSIAAIDSNHTIVVEFVEAERYTVDVSETSHGKVRIEGLDADGKAVEGRTITIVSTPDFGCFVSKIVINGDALFSTTGAEKSDSRTIAVDRYVSEQGTISIDVQFAYSASDDDDDPVPVPVPTPSQKSDDGDDNSGAIVAVVAGCVAVAIIAILVVAMRKE